VSFRPIYSFRLWSRGENRNLFCTAGFGTLVIFEMWPLRSLREGYFWAVVVLGGPADTGLSVRTISGKESGFLRRASLRLYAATRGGGKFLSDSQVSSWGP